MSRVAFLFLLAMALTGCGGEGSGLPAQDDDNTQSDIVSLQVTPASATIPVGFEQQYQAAARRADGAVLDVTRNPAVIWSSSDTSIATVDSQGLATGV
ncbi:Ig-like domain-containing protein, partial [Aeromonas dhakensis]